MRQAAESKPNLDGLWQQYDKAKDMQTRNELLTQYLHLVKVIVYRMMPTCHNYNEYDDLVSYGVIGLMDAIDKFNVHQGVKFETYATLRIRGEILDHLRRQDWAPSSLRRKISSIGEAYDRLEALLQRYPTESEVAAFLKMDIDELQKILEKTHTFNLVSFEELITKNQASSWDYAADSVNEPEAKTEKKEMNRLLANVIDSLPEKERLVLTLYYYEEMTLKEIAEVLGVSESRVSQIHSKILTKMRTKLRPLNS